MHARVDVHIIKFVVTNAILIYHWILSLNCRLFVSCMFNWIVYVELYVNPSVDKKLRVRYIYMGHYMSMKSLYCVTLLPPWCQYMLDIIET